MKSIKVKIELRNGANMPKYMTEGASGSDIYSNENVTIKSMDTALVPTGIFLEIPEGYECQIRPRSGYSMKNKILILNSPGTIDSDYRGEIKIIFFNLNDTPFEVKKGDRIAQMVFSEVIIADYLNSEIDETTRGDGGFGHTGEN